MSCQRSIRGVVFIALLAVGLLVVPVPGVGPQRAAVAEDIQLKFDEDMEMEAFLRSIARLTNTQMVWNPGDKNIRGKKIVGGFHLEGGRDDFLASARGLLTFYELVMIPIGSKDRPIMLVMDARATSSILKLKPEYVVLDETNLEAYERADGLFVTTTISVEHMSDLRNARNALTRIVTGQNIGNVTEVPAARAFVVTDFAPNVVAIYRLLKQMDKPGAAESTTDGKLVTITLEHAAATEVVDILRSQFGPTPVRVVGRGQPPPAEGPAAPRITADARTNKVLVSGTEAQIQKVKDAVAVLDLQVFATPPSAYLIRLSHVQAQEAAGALMQLIQGSPDLWRSGGPRGRPPYVVAHNETNSLLISAFAQDYEQVRRLVAEIDSKPAEDDE